MSEYFEDLTPEQAASIGDVVIVLRDKGSSGVVYIDGHRSPYKVTIYYGELDDPPQTIRQVQVRAGFTLKRWRERKKALQAAAAERAPEPAYGAPADARSNPKAPSNAASRVQGADEGASS